MNDSSTFVWKRLISAPPVTTPVQGSAGFADQWTDHGRGDNDAQTVSRNANHSTRRWSARRKRRKGVGGGASGSIRGHRNFLRATERRGGTRTSFARRGHADVHVQLAKSRR